MIDAGPPDPRRGSRARAGLALALWAAVLLAPSAAVAGGLLAGGLALLIGPRMLRARRRRSRARSAPAAGMIRLGTDPRTGRPVCLSDAQLAAHALIVGASGAGKSTTLLTVLEAQIARGRPVVAIDMKGSPAFAARLADAAAAAGRGLRVFTPSGPGHWNPLAHGDPTALKDKLISTERFTEPHYQRAAERYAQLALQVLRALHPPGGVALGDVVSAMEPSRLRVLLRRAPQPLAEHVQDYLGGLTADQLSAVRGLGSRLALLSESVAGPFLGPPGGGDALDRRAGLADDVIDLRAAVQGGDVVLLSLNSSVYGKLAAQLGALAIQDLVSVAGHRLDDGAASGARMQATVAVDEFSALGGDNILALLARGRESGVSVLLATQELSDLERAGRGFRDQALGIVGVNIAHRQDVPASAELFAQMAGTERFWAYTERVGPILPARGQSRGTRRLEERYIVHPNEIKTLPVGAAVILSKLPSTSIQRVQIDAPRKVGGARGAQAAANPPARPAEHSPPRTPGHSLDRPAGHPLDRAAGHPVDRPAGHPPDRATGQPLDRPTGHPPDRAAGPPPARAAARPPAQRSPDRSSSTRAPSAGRDQPPRVPPSAGRDQPPPGVTR